MGTNDHNAAVELHDGYCEVWHFPLSAKFSQSCGHVDPSIPSLTAAASSNVNILPLFTF